MGEWFNPAWDRLQQFADRHIRLFAFLIAALAIPLSLAYLAPVAIKAVVRPLDQMPPMGAGPATFTFLDADGRVIGRRGPVAGEVLHLNQMPAYLPAAFMAMEDRRFYRHHGVDFIGLARAAYVDLRAHRVVAGGSSISQQTAKLVFDRRKRTFGRKLRELVNTAILEKSFSKQQILQLYLNRIYLGGGAYGVDTAARTYFGVSARNVSLAQAAMLAALTRAPSVFSPRRDLAAAQERAARVLATMVEMGSIRPDQAAEAAAHPATVIARPVETHNYFLDAAADQARELAGDSGPGALIVHTTQQSELQAAANKIAANAVSAMGRKLNFSQIAMVAMKPDGAVTALVGGTSYARSVFDRAIQARRQPGSAFKPFVYLAALEKGISPWDWRDDHPVDIAGYQPNNYKDAHYGRLRLTDALARSVNTITVNLAQEVGIANVSAAARRAGITSPLQNNASLALGTNEVTPLELTAAYGTLASGQPVKPYLVSRIESAAGKLIFVQSPPATQPVIADQVRRDLTAMLYNVVMSGTGSAARLPDREAAGKTGTTQDYRDAWFVGFTSDYVAGIWIGNDDNRPMRKVTGGLVPAQLWRELMTMAENGQPARALDRTPEPSDVSESSAAEQGSFVDDVDAASPQLPVDEKGDFVASGSGVSPRRVARNDDYVPPQPALPAAPPAPVAPTYVWRVTPQPYQAPRPQVEAPTPQIAEAPRPPIQAQQRDVDVPPPRNYDPPPPRQVQTPSYYQQRETQPYYSRPVDGPSNYSVREGSPSYYSPRAAEAPYYGQNAPYYRQQVRPVPYQSYLDRREQPDARSYDPPPRSYYDRPSYYGSRQAPYDDGRDDYSGR